MIVANNISELVKLAEDLMDKNVHNAALICFNELINRDSSKAEYYRMRAKCYSKMQNRATERINDLKQVVTIAPRSNKNDRLILIQALFDVGRYDETIEESLKINDLNKLVTFGDTLMSGRNYPDAIRFYNVAIEKSPSMALYYKKRGTCYKHAQIYDKALSDFCQMVRFEPLDRQNKIVLLGTLQDIGSIDDEAVNDECLQVLSAYDLEGLGKQFFVDRKFNSALRCYTKALNMNPSESAYRLRGECYLQTRNFEMAIPDLRAALEIDSQSRASMFLLRQALSGSENFMDVPDDLLNLLNLSELQILGNEFRSQGMREEALRCYNAILNKNPSLPQAYQVRGNFYLEVNNMDLAVQDFIQAKRLNRRDQCNWNVVSEFLFNSRRYDELLKYTIDLTDVTELINLCDKFYSLGIFDEALRCYTEAINRNPSDLELYKRRGYFYWAMNDVNKTIEDLMHVAKKNPGDKENWSSLSRILFDCGRFDELIDHTCLVFDVDELVSLGDKFFSAKLYDQAISCYTKAIGLNVHELQFYIRRAKCFLEMERADMAIPDFLQAVELDPENEEIWFALSEKLFESEKFDELLDCAVLLNHTDVLKNLCSKFREAGKLDEAIRCYSEAIKKNPSDPDFYKQRAQFYVEIHQEHEAVVDLLTVTTMHPEENENWVSLAEILIKTGKTEELFMYALPVLTADQFAEMADMFVSIDLFNEAIRAYNEAISKEPYKADLYKRRGICFMKMNDSDMAIFDFCQAVEFCPEDKESLTLLNELLFDAGRFEELIGYTLALPDTRELANLGDKYLKAKKFDEAIRCYSLGLAKYPKDAALYLTKRGSCYWKMKNLDSAISDFKDALEREPSNLRFRINLTEAQTTARRYSDALRTITNINFGDLRREETMLLEKSRQDVERKRLNELKAYLQELIEEEAETRINEIRTSEADDVWWKIQELEFNRDGYLYGLKNAFDEHFNIVFSHTKGITGNNTRKIPDPPLYFTDAIQLDLIKNPVTTPYGTTFDRESITKYLQEFGKYDPTNRQPLEETELRPNHAVKEAIEWWKKENICNIDDDDNNNNPSPSFNSYLMIEGRR